MFEEKSANRNPKRRGRTIERAVSVFEDTRAKTESEKSGARAREPGYQMRQDTGIIWYLRNERGEGLFWIRANQNLSADRRCVPGICGAWVIGRAICCPEIPRIARVCRRQQVASDRSQVVVSIIANGRKTRVGGPGRVVGSMGHLKSRISG